MPLLVRAPARERGQRHARACVRTAGSRGGEGAKRRCGGAPPAPAARTLVLRARARSFAFTALRGRRARAPRHHQKKKKGSICARTVPARARPRGARARANARHRSSARPFWIPKGFRWIPSNVPTRTRACVARPMRRWARSSERMDPEKERTPNVLCARTGPYPQPARRVRSGVWGAEEICGRCRRPRASRRHSAARARARPTPGLPSSPSRAGDTLPPRAPGACEQLPPVAQPRLERGARHAAGGARRASGGSGRRGNGGGRRLETEASVAARRGAPEGGGGGRGGVRVARGDRGTEDLDDAPQGRSAQG